MQPVKIVIPGAFWDSLIYSGKLYLFTIDGDLITVDWDRVLEEWKVNEDLRFVMHCAFARNDLLYQARWQGVLSDPDVVSVLKRKFGRLSSNPLYLDVGKLPRGTLFRQQNPFPFPHSDALIYRWNMYTVSFSGVHRAPCRRKSLGVEPRVIKQWDCPVVSAAASWMRIALAAGDEGLYELPVEGVMEETEKKNPICLYRDNCTNCEWAYFSVYGSSHIGNSYLAAFTLNRERGSRFGFLEGTYTEEDRYQRVFESLVEAQDIFGAKGYSWGGGDKLYQAGPEVVRVVRYNPWEKEPDRRFGTCHSIKLAPWKGRVVSGGVGNFGVIVECDHAMVVLPSDDSKVLTLPGEVVRWRTFPRSKYYENQLHLVYSDRVEVLSFGHDYFVEQEKKVVGMEERPGYRKSWGRSRPWDAF